MIYIFASLVWFFTSSVLHIILSKLRLYLRIPWAVPLGIFIAGFVGCIGTTLWLLFRDNSMLSLPLTGIALYAAATLAYVGVSASPSLGDESPTSAIVLYLLRNGPQQERTIYSLFTWQTLVEKRLSDLIASGWVREQKGTLVVTKQGKMFARFFLWYRNVLGISKGG